MRYLLLVVLMFMPLSLTAHSSEEFLNLIDQTKKSVVYVVNTLKEGAVQTVPSTPFSERKDAPDVDPGTSRRRATGTGFIVEGGYIITNWHVIENTKKVEVFFENGRISYPVTVIGFDEAIDIAVLKPGDNFPTDIVPLEWRTKKLRQGEEVWTVGHPLGFTYSITKGIVSHVDRRIESPWQQTIQVDAAINSGNSGGPLLDMDGKVAGINVMLVSDTSSFSGIALSIDYNVAKRATATLIKYGEIVRPLMGVLLSYDIDALSVIAKGMTPNGAAEAAGIEEGDLYLEVDGKIISFVNDVFDILALKQPGDILTVKIMRDGEVKVIEVILSARPADLQ